MAPFDLIVIGAGPGGYVCAIRAAQLGLRVACVEKETDLGGTCLRVGCIPSKALLEASEHYAVSKRGLARFGVKLEGVTLDLKGMMRHKDRVVRANTKGVAFLFKKNQVERFHGTARLIEPGKIELANSDGTTAKLEARNIVIATGSAPSSLPGIELDGDRIGTSTEALAYPDVPGKLIVIGAGYIGLELGSVWNRLGADVTVLEFLPRILPGMDSELARAAERTLSKSGLDIRTSCQVTGARAGESEATVTYRDKNGEEQTMVADRVLVSIGRHPVTEELGLQAVGVELDELGRVQVDERYQTNIPGIYAIGDVIAGPMLAHKASEEGVAVAEQLAGGHGHVNYDAIPGVVYTDPEIATVGKSEDDLKAEGIPYRKGNFPFSANGRARAAGAVDGFAKVLAHKQTDHLLGVHIIGPHAGELIAEAALAIGMRASAKDIASSCHAHPTLAEVLKEAALDAGGHAIHI